MQHLTILHLIGHFFPFSLSVMNLVEYYKWNCGLQIVNNALCFRLKYVIKICIKYLDLYIMNINYKYLNL